MTLNRDNHSLGKRLIEIFGLLIALICLAAIGIVFFAFNAGKSSSQDIMAPLLSREAPSDQKLLGTWNLTQGGASNFIRFLPQGRALMMEDGETSMVSYDVTSLSNLVIVSQTETTGMNFLFISKDELVLQGQGEKKVILLNRQK